jgi:hypothetical protein
MKVYGRVWGLYQSDLTALHIWMDLSWFYDGVTLGKLCDPGRNIVARSAEGISGWVRRKRGIII